MPPATPRPPDVSRAPAGAFVIVVFGPPLPGRSALARALERRLPAARRLRAPGGRLRRDRIANLLAAGGIPVVEIDLATVAERAEAARELAELGADVRWVAWLCDEGEVEREVYRRYASIPRRYADHWWRRWQADQARREPVGDELPRDALVATYARGSILDHVVRVAASLGLPGAFTPRPPPPQRILVVDDEPDERTAVAEAFAALGCVVHDAADADQALAVLSEEPIDLVVSDQVMPGISGVELAAEIARRHPDVHVALLTGHAEETVDDALRTAGVDLLLAKPARAADLIRLLDEMTDEPIADEVD